MHSFLLTYKSLQKSEEENDDLKRIIKGYESIINHRKNECMKREKLINEYMKNINDLNLSIKIKNQKALNKRNSNSNDTFMNKTGYKKFFTPKIKYNIIKPSKTESLNCFLKTKKLAPYSRNKVLNVNNCFTTINTNKKNLSSIRKFIKNINKNYKSCSEKKKIYLKTSSNFFKSKINKIEKNHINYAKISKNKNNSTFKKTGRSLSYANNKDVFINQKNNKINDTKKNKNNKNSKNKQNEIDKVFIDRMLKKHIKNDLMNITKKRMYNNILNNTDLKILYNVDKKKIDKMINSQSNDNKIKMNLQEYQNNLIHNNSSFINKNNRKILLKSFQWVFKNHQTRKKDELVNDYINRIQKEEFDIINKNNKDNENLINKFLQIGISPGKFNIKIDKIECENVLTNK